MRILIGPEAPLLVKPTLIVGPVDRIEVRPEPIAVTVVRPSAALLIERLDPITVDAPQRAVWDDRGWVSRRDGNRVVYEGLYHVPNRKTGRPETFDGRIVEGGRRVAAFVADPPEELRKHPKAACFARTTGPWFQVNWYRAANTVDDALLYMEKVLVESLSGRY